MIGRGGTQVGSLLEIIPGVEGLLFLPCAALFHVLEAGYYESEVRHLIWQILYHLEYELWMIQIDIFLLEIAVFEQVNDGDLLLHVDFTTDAFNVELELFALVDMR